MAVNGPSAGSRIINFLSASLTFVFGPKHEDPVTRHDLKLVVFGWAGHLDGSQWDHSFRVNILKEHRGEKSKVKHLKQLES